jgi:hypothetical protein
MWVGTRQGQLAAGEKILIRDGAMVVVIGSETSRSGSLLVLKSRVQQLWNASDRTGIASVVLIDKE